MTDYAEQERQDICATFLEVGPEAPTLDDPWLARDLAAHLVVRDHRPDLTVGMLVPPLRGRLERVQAEIAHTDYPALVERVRQGPPAWSPARIRAIDEMVNGTELFIHHEDLLRARHAAPRRSLDVGEERFLWEQLVRGARLFFRPAPVGVELVAEGYGRRVAKDPTSTGSVVLRGRPGELALYASGRARVADVEVDGHPHAVAEIEAAKLGM